MLRHLLFICIVLASKVICEDSDGREDVRVAVDRQVTYVKREEEPVKRSPVVKDSGAEDSGTMVRSREVRTDLNVRPVSEEGVRLQKVVVEMATSESDERQATERSSISGKVKKSIESSDIQENNGRSAEGAQEQSKQAKKTIRVQDVVTPPKPEKRSEEGEEEEEDNIIRHKEKPFALIVLPLTVVAIFLALNLWAPNTLVSGGYFASVFAVIIPSFVLQHLGTANEGTYMKMVYKWLSGDQEDIEANRKTDGAATKAHAKSKIKDWWSGGRLGKQAAMGSKKAFTWVPREFSNPSPKETFSHSHSRKEKKKVEAREEASKPSTPQHKPSLQEVNLNLLRAVEQEELLRTRMEREEGEDRWGLGRQEDTEHMTILTKAIRMEMRAVQELERAQRAIVVDDWRYALELIGIEKRADWKALVVTMEKDQMQVGESQERDDIAKQEQTTRVTLHEAYEYDYILVMTRPDRERLTREEATGRMEVEDDEVGERCFVDDSQGVQLMEVLEYLSRRRTMDCEAQEMDVILSHVSSIWLQDMGKRETKARNDIDVEHCSGISVMNGQRDLSFLEARESVNRTKYLREERSTRKTVQVQAASGQQLAMIKQTMMVTISDEEVARSVVLREEEDAFLLHELVCTQEYTVAEEGQERRRVAEEEATVYEEAQLELFNNLATAMAHEKELLAELHKKALRNIESNETDARNREVSAEEAGWDELIKVTETSRAQAMQTEQLRMEHIIALIAELLDAECCSRVPIVDEEADGFAPFAEFFEIEKQDALCKQKERSAAEEQERQLVVQEESEIRAIFEKTQKLQWETMLTDETDERDRVEIMGLIGAIVSSEELTRQVEIEAEVGERGELQKQEFGTRTKINEELIRGTSKKTETSTEVVRMIVVSDGAQVRAGKAMQSAKVTVLPKGAIVHVVERVGGRGRLHEYDGWVSVRSQTGMVLLKPLPLEGDAPVELPERSEESPAPATGPVSAETPQPSQASKAAEEALAQVSNSIGKGWRSFAGALGEVRLPGTPMTVPPKKKQEAPSASEPTPAPSVTPPPKKLD
eukprot:TRINITY_DN12081_c0_g1_i1.p1 TRINITY_DN12081_c0_g1~~TRINITY_DN12081_c0_g1_i1.p1  ORF type:complete len:1053 (+),score=199.40 TRINITY_DN12081_c0_g1_i1:45-3203(+)